MQDLDRFESLVKLRVDEEPGVSICCRMRCSVVPKLVMWGIFLNVVVWLYAYLTLSAAPWIEGDFILDEFRAYENPKQALRVQFTGF